MMRKMWAVFILLILSLSRFSLTTRAQETTAEPTAETTAVIEAPTAEVTAEATQVTEPVPPTEAPPTENPDSAEDAPTGLGTLVLLMGLGAVSIVGLTMVARENL